MNVESIVDQLTAHLARRQLPEDERRRCAEQAGRYLRWLSEHVMGGPADPTAAEAYCQHLRTEGGRDEDELGARRAIGLLRQLGRSQVARGRADSTSA
jgi:hypothetical protein